MDAFRHMPTIASGTYFSNILSWIVNTENREEYKHHSNDDVEPISTQYTGKDAKECIACKITINRSDPKQCRVI